MTGRQAWLGIVTEELCLNSAEQRAAAVLADRADTSATVSLGHRELSRQAECSYSTVRRLLAMLEATGYVAHAVRLVQPPEERC